MQLSEIKAIFHKELEVLYPKDEIDGFFYTLVEHYLQQPRFILALQPRFTLSKEEEAPFFTALAQLKIERPLQYILGETHFMGIPMHVDENVLIPRPETEELVQWIVNGTSDNTSIKNDTSGKESTQYITTPSILDIGTGSGCIAISLAKLWTNAEVVALDVSGGALKIARRNARLNTVAVQFIKADILDPEFRMPNTTFDIIVSNPPYVREMEKSGIRNNVKKYEPPGALFVPDDAPLLFYGAIAQFAQAHLRKGGQLYLEINQYLGRETQSLLKRIGFMDIELKKDIFGNDRMLKAVWKG
ncbi:MAG: peptide chain release factor N(5)-glutamine methyltransferase [Flavobacteriaceae bacterium]